MKKCKAFFIFLLIGIGVVLLALLFKDLIGTSKGPLSMKPFLQNLIGQSSVRIPTVNCPFDKDSDGLDDLKDIVAGAKSEVKRQPQYRSTYYQGGYPPEQEGVCTDVVWRAFKDAGYDLKAIVDKDIRQNLTQYSRIGGKPDPNIDFRRVPNLIVYFKRNAQVLTQEVKPADVENLSQWQPGDIVTFADPHEHIAIISDKRRADGVPYILHNAGPIPAESDQLQSWPSPITGHFRFPHF